MDISEKILSDPVNKWVFSLNEKNVFLVGGYIRDLIRGCDTKDKDYVLNGDIRQTAVSASKKFNGTFIEFKKKQTYRVALQGGNFIDFTYLKKDILRDINQRDFTINAMAWSPDTGIYDPLKGESDLKHSIIRAVNEKNLLKDPLRVLRAYRLSAHLGFNIEDETREYLKKYSPGLKNVASERITDELIKIINSNNAGNCLTVCNKDKVLNQVLDTTESNLSINLTLINKFDHLLLNVKKSKFKRLYKFKIFPILRQHISQGLTREGLIRLSLLLRNINKTDHHEYHKIKVSQSVIKKLQKIQNGISMIERRITDNILYEMLNSSHYCEFEIALIISLTRPRFVDKYIRRAEEFIEIRKNSLLDGYSIQKILNSGPDKTIGIIQEQIRRKRFLGLIRNRNDARDWIISNFT